MQLAKPSLAWTVFVATLLHNLQVTDALLPFHASSSRSGTNTFSQPRKRTSIGKSYLSASHQDDLEDQIVSILKTWNSQSTKAVLRSDIPSDDVPKNQKSPFVSKFQSFKEGVYARLPPPPEDQFIMTGDIFTIFLYAFTSHSVNDAIVSGLLDNPSMTIVEAIEELDPLHEMVTIQHPVWVDLSLANANIPFGNPALDHALTVSARESLLNHWGPLLSTEGSACVALCSCWLLAGWIHEAFLYDRSTYCGGDKALTTTVQTWVTASALLVGASFLTDSLVLHFPILQELLCLDSDQIPSFLTQSDLLFIVDSLTVLIAWRWSAHRVLNTFR